MEVLPHSNNHSRKITIPQIQKYLFYALLFVLPLSILPFSWDWTERGMSIVILSFSALILGLEVLRVFVEGKLSVLKSSSDVGIFLLVLSLLLSTLFSRDMNTSLWGIDGKLGGGLVAFLSLVLLSFSIRLFIKDEKDIRFSILFFLCGMILNNILSLLSFLGVNVWGMVPIYKELSQVGLPLFRSSKLHILVNIVSVLLSLGLLGGNVIFKKEKYLFILSIISLVFSVLNIWFFSINVGASLVISLIVVIGFLLYLVFKKLKLQELQSKSIFLFLIITALAILIPFILLQIPAVRSLIIPKSIDIIAQVSLGLDLSWSIASSVFVNSFSSGLFGFGPDTYSIAYNLFKPINTSLISFNSVNFYYSGNEILTQLPNGGLFWLASWGIFGFILFKSVILDFLKLKQYGNTDTAWYLIVIDTIMVLIFVASFFSPYFVIINLLLLMMISFRSILRDILNRGTADRFVLKLWTASMDTESGDGKNFKNLNILMTVVISIISFGFLGFWVSKGIASMYALKAEAFYVEENRKYEGDVYPTLEEREEFTTNMSRLYGKAVDFDKENPYLNRKKGLMYLERIGISAEKYSNLEDGDNKDQIIKDVGMWKNYTIDSVRKSIDLSSAVYANWEASTRVYMGLIGMGFYDYVTDAIYSLDQAIELNPTNYELYYSKAQVYVIKSEKDAALSALTKALSLNPQHIPSILLAGDLNKDMGNLVVYESYLKAAKKILEVQGSTTLEIYNEISKQLNALSSGDEDQTDDSKKSEDSSETEE